MQLEDPLKTTWKQSTREQTTNLNALSPYNHHQIKKKIPLGKLNSKELYNILILGNYENTTSQEYFEVFLESTTID